MVKIACSFVLVMIAETISLGILSLPSVLARVGMIPGIILIASLGVIATYTGYVLGQFKWAYPHVSISRLLESFNTKLP